VLRMCVALRTSSSTATLYYCRELPERRAAATVAAAGVSKIKNQNVEHVPFCLSAFLLSVFCYVRS